MTVITQRQFAYLSMLLGTHTPAQIVTDFTNEAYPLTSPLYDLSLDDLIKFLYTSDYKIEKPKFERSVGDVYDRKDFEYTVLAKVPHDTDKDRFVYLISQRRFGEDNHEYFVEIY